MADITMCKDEECDKRETCYRYIAPPTPNWQSMFMNSPRFNDNCDRYWEATKYEINNYEERQNDK